MRLTHSPLDRLCDGRTRRPRRTRRARSHRSGEDCDLSCETFDVVNGAWVYIVSDGANVKIGVSKDYRSRVKHLQTASGKSLTVLASVFCVDAYRAERNLHDQFADYRQHGEWFALEPSQIAQLLGEVAGLWQGISSVLKGRRTRAMHEVERLSEVLAACDAKRDATLGDMRRYEVLE